MENVIDILLQKREEEINLTKEEQESILKEKKIYLQNIIDKIKDEEIQRELLKYEEQQSKINAVYDELFYKAGFKDGQKNFQ